MYLFLIYFIGKKLIKKSYRNIQVSEEIKKEISKIIQTSCNDIRISRKVTILDVIVSRDFSYSKIFFSILDEKFSDEMILILQNSSSYIRKLLSKNLFLRTVPKLKFIYDNSFLEGARVSNIIMKILNNDKYHKKDNC